MQSGHVIIWKGTGASLWFVYPVQAWAQPFKNTENPQLLILMLSVPQAAVLLRAALWNES